LTIASNESCCFIDEQGETEYRFIVMPCRVWIKTIKQLLKPSSTD
jgi:hypothetical protein